MRVVYGVSRRRVDPPTGRRWRVPRYYGWAVNLLATDGAFRPTPPHLLRPTALVAARELAHEWDPAARPGRPDEAPNGYANEQ